MYKNLFSVLLGLLFGYITIKLMCPIEQHHGPNSNQIKRFTYIDKKNGQCYKFIPQAHICPLKLLKKS